MAFDGITNNALIYELTQKICNGRIEKIHQPERDEIYINIRNNKSNYVLLLSANANNPRAYLTENTKSNPLTAPTFCMLLRKNLTRGKILSIKQPSMERIIEIEISSINELGDPTIKVLIIEIMGRHSNIILIDKSNYHIIDSIKRVGSNISRYRQVLPGNDYIYPPNQNKQNPLISDKEQISTLLNEFPKTKKIEKFFIDTFTGISPLIARETCFISGVNSDQFVELVTEKQKKFLVESFIDIVGKVKSKHFSPGIIYNHGKNQLVDFSVLPLRQFADFPTKEFDSVSYLMEQFYFERDKLERMKQKNSDLLHHLNNKLERSYKKLVIQQDEYRQSQDAVIYKLYGELITANVYALKKGMDKADLTNFYSEEQEKIEVPLNINLTPVKNAQKYFKKYSKSKNALQQLTKHINTTEEEIYYLESQIENIRNCTEPIEIEEIKDELRKEGYLSKTNKKPQSKNPPPSSPLHFISSEGLDIFVGKNNKQNDSLTLKSSSPKDLWFHTKDIPGSHVVVRFSQTIEISEKTILEAATLSAYYSKARNSSKVPVSYTNIKNVKKPNNSKPGMVIYENYQTLFVTPTEDTIHSLKRVK